MASSTLSQDTTLVSSLNLAKGVFKSLITSSLVLGSSDDSLVTSWVELCSYVDTSLEEKSSLVEIDEGSFPLPHEERLNKANIKIIIGFFIILLS